MEKYEVVVAIYKKGAEEPMQEETVLETDDYAEAVEEFECLTTEDAEEAEPEEAEATEEG